MFSGPDLPKHISDALVQAINESDMAKVCLLNFMEREGISSMTVKMEFDITRALGDSAFLKAMRIEPIE